MEDIVRYRALEAFCRQRAQMEGEGSAFWLEEADILAQLIITESRLKILAASHEEEKGSQTWEPEFHQSCAKPMVMMRLVTAGSAGSGDACSNVKSK
jgi:hypothetical protein